MIQPVISEKSLYQAASGVYHFVVPIQLSKLEIKELVEQQFDVEVDNVWTLIRKGKAKIFKRVSGKRSDFKIARVKLTKGKITIFESEQEQDNA
ncbi:50S ribosomal protein L23 [Candidatus Saccharibacteria bacterium]|nr:50S ribosomal protein L23 [Candidatus Saccharibacteria bacterium]